MNEMVNEYLLQLDMVNYAFHERVKVHQSYAVTVEILKKKLNEKVCEFISFLYLYIQG